MERWDDTKLAEHYRAAADWLEDHRWIRHKMWTWRGDTPVGACLLGALEVVADSSSDVLKVLQPLNEIITPKLPRNSQLVTARVNLLSWNDRRERRKPDVLALFRQAADNCELRAAIKDLPKQKKLHATSGSPAKAAKLAKR